MTFLETTTDLQNPLGSVALGAPNPVRNQTQQVSDLNDAVVDLHGVAAGPIWRSAKAFLPVPTAVLDNADAITNWVGVSLNSAIAVDNTVKMTGTGSVKMALRTDNAASKGYLNVPGAPSTTGKVRLVFDLRWTDVNSKATLRDCFEFFISTAAGIGGTVTAFPIPVLSQSAFMSLTVPIAGIATLGSFGIRHKGAGFTVAGSIPTINAWVDNVRWEATEFDVALASADAVMIPATYTSAVPQNPYVVPAGKTVVDLRPNTARISRLDGIYHARDFGLPEDGSVNVRPYLMWIIAQMLPGDILDLAPGDYLYNGGGILNRVNDIWVRFNGAKLYRTEENSTTQGNAFNFSSCQRVRFSGGALFGFRSDLTNGSVLTSVASNLLPEQASSFQNSIVAIPENHNWTNLANTSSVLQRVAATTQNGFALQIWNAGAAATTIAMTQPVTTLSPMDVEPSTSYVVSASFKPFSAPAQQMPWAARTCQRVVKWYTAAGASAGADSTVSVVETDQNTWAVATGTVTSPATAAKASMEVRVVGALAGDLNGAAAAGSNGGTSALASAVTSSALTFTLNNAGSFPATGSFTCHFTEANGVNEMVLCDSRSGNVVTVNAAGRGYGGTTAIAHAANTGVKQLLGENHVFDSITLTRSTPRVLTTSGTTVQLTNPGDEVKIPNAKIYARDKDWQYRFDVMLSASASVTDDCEIVCRDEDTGEVLAKRVLTLPATGVPGTPVSYSLIFTRNDYTSLEHELYRRMRWSVRKVKTTANTITVSSATEIGRCDYGRGDAANGFVVSDEDPDSSGIVIEDFLVEGVGGDAIMYTASSHRCRGINVISRANGRQGFSQAGGADNALVGCRVYGCGRSCLDMEPEKGRIIKRPRVFDFRGFRPVNAGIAMTGWQNTEYGIFDDIYIYGVSGVANPTGGRHCIFTNLVSENALGSPSAPDWEFSGVDSIFDNVVATNGISVTNTSKTLIDEGGNSVTVVSSGNKLGKTTVKSGSYGVQVAGDNYADPTVSRSPALVAVAAGLASFTVAVPAQSNATYAVFLELGWHATWRITAKTTTSFTFETSVPVPVGGSSFNWMTAGV